jgi:preprotein translocase subunit SecG
MLKCGDRLYLFYFNIQRTNSLRLSIEKGRLIIGFFTRMTQFVATIFFVITMY